MEVPHFLGRHVLAEFWECSNVDNPATVQTAMVAAAKVAGATVLNANLHHFGEGMGVTGVLILAESHMSIHSWPEYGYAAIDVFVCGKADPHKAIDSLRHAFSPKREVITEHTRGDQFHG
ncbi:MAG: adenosylmethionine decarboxylase [Aestuariivirga sp.]|nr:adenosylmethionine decarboxylase [Aestuariivirga sp.]